MEKKSLRQLLDENEELMIRLQEAEDTLIAIRNNEVDALVVEGPEGDRVFTLQGADQPYRIFVEAMSEGAAILGREGSILHCNNHLAELLKLPLNRLIGKSLYRFIFPAEGKPLEAMLSTCDSSGCRGEFILRSSRGQKTPVYLSARPFCLNGVEVFSAVISNIRERKRNEAELEKHRYHLKELVKERTARLRAANSQLRVEVRERGKAEERTRHLASFPQLNPSPVLELNASGTIVYSNEAAAAVLESQDMDRADVTIFVPLDMKEILREWDGNARMVLHREVRVGNRFFKEVVLFSPEFEMARIYAHEITDLKEAETVLRESEEQFRLMFERHKAVMLLIEPQSGAIVGANEAASQFYGYPSEQLISMHIQDINQLPPEQVAAERQKAVVEQTNHFSFRHRIADGRIRWVDVYSTPFEAQGRALLFSIIHDVTERKEAEEALKKSIERLDIISNTASQLLFTSDPQEIINALCEKVMNHLDCHVFFNFLVDEEMNCLRLNAYAGIDEEAARQIHFLEYGVAICGCVAQEACRIVAENIPTTPDVRTELIRSFGITAYVCHPLFAQDRVIGTLSFGTKSRLTFTVDEIALMKTISDQVAIAIERMHHLRSEKERADELEQQVAKRTTQIKQQAELLNLSHDAIILTDMNGKIIFWSTGAEETYQFSKNEAVGNMVHDMLQTRSQIPIKDIMNTIKQKGHWEGELDHICKEGKKLTVHSRWALRQNEVNGTTEIMEVNRDITYRKQVEEAVKEERERLYNVLETLPAYVVLLTQDYQIPFANRVFRELFGDPEGRQCFQHLFKRTEPCEVCETYKVLKYNEPQRWQWTGPNGHTYDIYDFPFISGDGSNNILEMGIDITDRKQAEDKVRIANEYNRSLIESNPDPLVTINEKGLITDVNVATEKVTGHLRHELIGTDFSDYFTDPDKAREGYEQVFREGIVRDYEIEIRHNSGYVTPVLYNASVYKDKTGDVVGVFAVARDISALRNTERALKESEERYRTAIESASDGIAFMKEDRHVFVNRRFAEIFGYDDPNEIIGKPLSVTVHPDDLHMVSELNRLRQNGESATSRYEFRGIRNDGTVRIIEVSATKSNYLGESVSLAYLRDITDYKNLEEQLRHSQKMEAVGVLAGGIAHDFNNILAAIIGFAEMVEEDIPQGKPKVQHVQRVINAASRGRDLVQQILAFSRKTERARHPVSLSAIAEETVQLMRASIPTTIDIKLNITATSDTILATPVEIQQVLMNLATNAALSMQEKGGVLQIGIENVGIDSHSPFLEAEMVPGEYLKLVVGDTGSGMTREVMDRIFEPFFTTREVGQGTGMGLAVVYGIVKSLHGSIRVESERGVGSTFSVYLPKIQDNAQTEKYVSELSPGGKERVLFVDDEEFLVEWGKALLKRLGYEVVALNDSTEALEVFSSEPGAFDLIITDQTMPVITGIQLAREFRKIRPEIPIIICTGHSDAVTLDKLEEIGVRELLMKPLTRKELAESIHRVLHKEH